MTDEFESTYDLLPYPGSPFPQTHPDRLATIATLFGMEPAGVASSRVLELGCTDGGNLIPMAVAYPDADFTGIDLSRRQIADGQKTVDQLQLQNIRLIQQDILNVTDEYGHFDYIIAHGVFSWVPPVVQEKIFAVTKQLLNPQGVAYVSYNTYPGWHMRGMLRDMMLFHTRQFSEPEKRIEQARALIDFLARAVPSREDPYGLLLSSELESMQSWADSYIFHESLEAHNEPLYFHQFAERAGRHGLRYLGEASLSAMLAGDLNADVAATLNEVGRDIIEMEQYLDFVRNRTFRQTLLCHDNVDLERTLSSTVCDRMQIRAQLTPQSEHPDFLSAAPEEFRAASGTTMTVRTPIQKAAFLALSLGWPACSTFDQLLSQARSMLYSRAVELRATSTLEEEESDLREGLFTCFCDQIVEFHAHPPAVAHQVSERPMVSPLTRLQAETSEWVTTLLHEQVRLDVVNAHIVRHLNGQNDVQDLVEILTQLTKVGSIVATQQGEIISDSDQIESELRHQLEWRLAELARLGVLVS